MGLTNLENCLYKFQDCSTTLFVDLKSNSALLYNKGLVVTIVPLLFPTLYGKRGILSPLISLLSCLFTLFYHISPLKGKKQKTKFQLVKPGAQLSITIRQNLRENAKKNSGQVLVEVWKKIIATNQNCY